MDPDARLLLLHLYDQNLKCVPVGGGRAPLLREAFNVRIDESQARRARSEGLRSTRARGGAR